MRPKSAVCVIFFVLKTSTPDADEGGEDEDILVEITSYHSTKQSITWLSGKMLSQHNASHQSDY